MPELLRAKMLVAITDRWFREELVVDGI